MKTKIILLVAIISTSTLLIKCSSMKDNLLCMNYSNEPMNTLSVDLIRTMTKKYRTNQLSFINTNPNFKADNNEDAHSIWFDLETLKKFVYNIEKNAIEGNLSSDKLGIRIYYAAYPSTSKEDVYAKCMSSFQDLENVPEAYHDRHTLVLIPTVNLNGKNVDFDPLNKETYKGGIDIKDAKYAINSTYKTSALSGSSTTTLSTDKVGAQNHGSLIPPATNNVETYFP